MVPGSLIVERNVLEWRFDPRCPARLPQAVDYDVPVMILCQEGYTSSLAAAALQDVGLHRATDVVGGFAAWRIAGLPALGPTPLHSPSSLASRSTPVGAPLTVTPHPAWRAYHSGGTMSVVAIPTRRHPGVRPARPRTGPTLTITLDLVRGR
ncbi:rhodanese-like domain-containing protein [Micromonospora sp. M12]